MTKQKTKHYYHWHNFMTWLLNNHQDGLISHQHLCIRYHARLANLQINAIKFAG